MPTTPAPSANLLQLLPEAVVQTDALWEITYLNPAWHKLTGHSVEAALGRSLLEFVHPDDIGTMRSGMPVFRLRFADGDYRWVRLQFHPETDAAERVISRQGVLIEITEVTEQVLVEVRQRFLRLLETIDGVVWEAEIGVGNTFLSPQVERLFGYSVEEWRADPGFWRAHVHPDDLEEALRIDDAAYNATHSHAYEMSYRLIAKSGKVVWVRDLCRAVVEPGRPNRMIGLMIDVTQQKNTEIDLVRSKTAIRWRRAVPMTASGIGTCARTPCTCRGAFSRSSGWVAAIMCMRAAGAFWSNSSTARIALVCKRPTAGTCPETARNFRWTSARSTERGGWYGSIGAGSPSSKTALRCAWRAR